MTWLCSCSPLPNLAGPAAPLAPSGKDPVARPLKVVHTRELASADNPAGEWAGDLTTPVTETPYSDRCRGYLQTPTPLRTPDLGPYLFSPLWASAAADVHRFEELEAVDQKSNMGCSPGHRWATRGGDERLTAVTQSEPWPASVRRRMRGVEYFQVGRASSIPVTRPTSRP
jgi:hypothetical protein